MLLDVSSVLVDRKEKTLEKILSALSLSIRETDVAGWHRNGTVIGIINAFRGMKNAESAGIAAVAGGISEALFTTALGLLVAVPAVWLFNYFTGKVDGFIVEMDNSASELVDYFIKNRTKQLKP